MTITNHCGTCGRQYETRTSKSRYCSRRCKDRAAYLRDKAKRVEPDHRNVEPDHRNTEPVRPVYRYQDDIAEFIAESAEFAPRTQAVYKTLIGYYAVWCDAEGRDMQTTNAAAARAWLDGTEWGNSMRHVSSCAIRAFSRWMWGGDHPLTRFRIRREEAGPQRVLDFDQVERLLDSIDGDRPVSVRNRAIIALMLDTGLRSSEVCALKTDSLSLNRLYLKCRVKGGAQQVKTFNQDTGDLIEAWLRIRGEHAAAGVHTLFVAVNGRGAPITPGGLRGIFRGLGKQAGLGAFSPHDLRRTMATLAIRAGAPSRLVQLQGGWKDLKQLERYTEGLDPEDFKPYSPVAAIDRRKRRRAASQNTQQEGLKL